MVQSKRSELKHRLAYGAGVVALIYGTAAFGQAAPAAAADPSQVDEVVVTGTRLVNAGFNAPTPLTMIGAETIQQRAPTAIIDVLNDLSSFRPSAGPTQNQRNSAGAGAGQATVDLRGLGSVRTLVLVNGRRVTPTNTGSTVDTGIIPAGLVERVDVVTGGASAAYGSDAVAGVVNFVLKSRMDGLEGTVQVGRSTYGDNKEIGFNIAGGRQFADGRARVLAGFDYNKNDGVGTIYSRDWAAIEPGNSGTPIAFGANRGAGVPAQGFLPNVEFSTQTRGGIINSARTATGASTALNQIAFTNNGALYTMARGQVYGNLMTGVTSNYGAGPLNNWPLRQQNERRTGMFIVNYDLTPDTVATADFNYGQTRVGGYTQFHQTPSNIILINNPFIPAALRQLMVQNNITQIDMGRIDTEWPGAGGPNKVDSYRGTLALNGKVFNDWSWEAYYQYGKSTIDSNLTGSAESNLLAATYVVAGANGQPVCGPIETNPNFAANRLTAIIDPSLVTPGCVPFNPFGVGQASKEAIDYVYNIQHTDIDLVRHAAAVNLSGSLFDLPAGAVSLATGVEFRKDTLEQRADPLAEKGIYSGGNAKSFSGETSVWDGYAEVGVPLIKDAAFAKSLDLNGAIRRTHYDTSGWVTTWKVGGVWDVMDGVRFRATKSRDIRAPTLNELFSFSGVNSSTTFFNPFTGVSARLPTRGGGNTALRPEIADTFTAGVVLQPGGLLQGFRVSVDYFTIDVQDVIANVSATDIIQRCYDKFTEFCGAITFDNSAFGIREVRTQPFNQANLKTDGFDIEASYRVPISDFGVPGSLDIRALATNTQHLTRYDRSGNLVVKTENVGTGSGVPKWTYNGFINYKLDNLTAGLQFRSFSMVRYRKDVYGPDQAGYNPAAANSININRFPSILYINANAAYDLRDKRIQIFGNVSNLTNQDPPALALAAINAGGNPYDYVGRTYKVGLRFKF